MSEQATYGDGTAEFYDMENVDLHLRSPGIQEYASFNAERIEQARLVGEAAAAADSGMNAHANEEIEVMQLSQSERIALYTLEAGTQLDIIRKTRSDYAKAA